MLYPSDCLAACKLERSALSFRFVLKITYSINIIINVIFFITFFFLAIHNFVCITNQQQGLINATVKAYMPMG